jgi:Anti-sigma-K factor rskA, C-terminal
VSGTADANDVLDGLDDRERERLERVRTVLVEAGPPPELPPTLADPPEPSDRVWPPVGRYRSTVVAIAIVAGVALFGIGYVLGGGETSTQAVETSTLSGDGGASGELAVLPRDGAGNWPVELTVRRLPALEDGEAYALWLTRAGAPDASCGLFAVGREATAVRLNCPYRLDAFDGWAVTRTPGERVLLQATRR